MQSYADTQRPITADIVLLDRGKHFARGRDGAPWRVGIVERRTKQRQEAVPEKLVHDAAVAIDDLDQYRERCVQSLDNLLRSAVARRGRKATDVDEHDGDLPRIAAACRAGGQQAARGDSRLRKSSTTASPMYWHSSA